MTIYSIVMVLPHFKIITKKGEIKKLKFFKASNADKVCLKMLQIVFNNLQVTISYMFAGTGLNKPRQLPTRIMQNHCHMNNTNLK